MTSRHFNFHALIIGGMLTALLAGCNALPERPTRPIQYDFGPGPLTPQPANRMAPLAPLALAEVETSGAFDGTAVLYRLAYTNAQELRPYSLARWSMPPAQLLSQRARQVLGERRTLLVAGESAALNRQDSVLPRVLRLELDEFSHFFESPTASSGLIKLRATVIQVTPGGEKLLAQRPFVVQQPAESGDAPGGVRAIAAATDAALREISQWVEQVQ